MSDELTKESTAIPTTHFRWVRKVVGFTFDKVLQQRWAVIDNTRCTHEWRDVPTVSEDGDIDG